MEILLHKLGKLDNHLKQELSAIHIVLVRVVQLVQEQEESAQVILLEPEPEPQESRGLLLFQEAELQESRERVKWEAQHPPHQVRIFQASIQVSRGQKTNSE